MSLEWLLSLDSSLLLGHGNKQLVWGSSRVQIEAIVALLIIVRAHVNIYFKIKVKIPILVKWSYGSPQLWWLSSLGLIIIFWAHCPISFAHMSFWCHFLKPHLTTYHSNIGVKFKKVKNSKGCLPLPYLHGQFGRK